MSTCTSSTFLATQALLSKTEVPSFGGAEDIQDFVKDCRRDALPDSIESWSRVFCRSKTTGRSSKPLKEERKNPTNYHLVRIVRLHYNVTVDDEVSVDLQCSPWRSPTGRRSRRQRKASEGVVDWGVRPRGRKETPDGVC